MEIHCTDPALAIRGRSGLLTHCRLPPVLSFGAYAAIFLPSGSIFKPSAPIPAVPTGVPAESRRLTSKYCIVPAFSIDFSLTVQSAVRKYRSTGCTVYHSTCTSTVPVPVHPGTDVHFCTGVLMNLLVFSTDRVVSTNTNYHSYLCTEYCPILISICSLAMSSAQY